MKNSVIFILSLFVYLSCFSQGMEKRYFENNPTLGGDAVIKSSSFKVENDEIHKTFEVEISETGAYYLDAWITAPFTEEGYRVYEVAVNGISAGFTFKPQTAGWHSLALTNVKKSAATVNLNKGINIISVIGKGPEIPNVEFIKLSSSLSKTGIPDSNYKEFVERVRSNTLNEVYNIDSQQVSSSRGTNGEIYDYYLNLPYNYTQWWTLSLSSGNNVNISAGSSSFPCVIELFHISNPDSYSWSAKSTTGTSNLITAIPVSGYYVLLLRSLNPINIGLTTMTLSINNGSCSTVNDCIVTYSPQVAVTSGYTKPANFFTCKIGGGGTWLFLANNLGRIRAYNDNGGKTSDGYSWGNASRIKTTLSDISYGLVFKKYVYTPNYDTCDLYMGLAQPSNSLQNDFPELALDNSFKSGSVFTPAGGDYNCFDWSVGITGPPNNINSFTEMDDWDSFYGYYGYTRDGANSTNAAIALSGVIACEGSTHEGDTIIRHASVRKHSKTPNPHGFEWESKIAYNRDRVMHTRDALVQTSDQKCPELNQNFYGSILLYYRPKSGTVNKGLPGTESYFSASDLNRIDVLKNNIPVTVTDNFDRKYLTWKETVSKPESASMNDPYLLACSSEYNNLLNYCMKYGKAVWPLVIDKLAGGDVFVISLLKDLTYRGNPNFVTEIIPSVTGGRGKPFPSLYFILAGYCKGLLAKEEVNMLNSIRDISAIDEESFEMNIATVNGQEIVLSLSLVKDEKASVTIYNVFGGLEYEAGYNLSKGSHTMVINISNFKKGVYIVKTTIGGESISQTISI